MKRQYRSAQCVFDTNDYVLKNEEMLMRSWNEWARRMAPFCMVFPESVHELRARLSVSDFGGLRIAYCQISESQSLGVSASMPGYCLMPPVWLLIQPDLPMTIEYSGEKCALESGDLVLLDGEQPFTRPYGAAKFRAFSIPKPLMGDFQEDLRIILGRNLTKLSDSAKLLAAYTRSLDEELVGNILKQSVSVQHAISHHLVVLLKSAIQQAQDCCDGVGRNGAERELFREVLLWVQENYMDSELCVELVARQFNITPRHVHRLFRESSHKKTFLETVHYLRLHHARQLLESQAYRHLLVSEIAMLCGFSDHVNFSKFFKRYFAITPGGLRKQSLSETES